MQEVWRAFFSLKMKKRKTEDFYCVDCDKKFPYRSKYERHMVSQNHQRFARSLVARDEQCIESMEREVFPPSRVELSCGDSDVEEEIYDSIEVDEDESSSESEISEVECYVPDSVGNDYHPFQSKIQALTYMLTSGPRPMGEENLKFVFHIMKSMDPTTPSLSAIKKLSLPGFTEPTRHITASGIPFYMNSPSSIIRRCISIPDVARQLTRFPVVPKKDMYEIYHGSHWMLNERFFTPMIKSHIGDVFIGDFVKYIYEDTVKLAKVKCFFTKEGFDGIYMKLICLEKRDSIYVIHCEVSLHVNALVGHASPPSLLYRWNMSTSLPEQLSQRELQAFTSAHRLKEASCGKPVVLVPIILFTDDTSGNKSKQWNKFDSWCLKIAGLPNKENSKLDNIHLICCSNKCNVLDMSKPLAEDLFALETTGITSYDAALEEEVLVVAPVLCVLSDNPRHSEIMNHAGASAKMYCRICKAEKGRLDGEIATLRTKLQTLREIQEIMSKPTEKERAQLKTKYGVTTSTNPLLGIPIDLHRSTPIETLHTILLGPYKYLLRSFIARLSMEQKEEVQAILSTFNFSGIQVKLCSKLFKYHKSFVGRDFKSLAQCALYIFRSHFTDAEKTTWLALSKVFKIAYCEHFSVQDEIKSREICRDFVKAIKDHFPEYAKKVKIHLLLHLVDSMISFGPTSAFNTERCESFNSLIRARNIFSNRQAPSRDIAKGFAVIGYLRSLCLGGLCDITRVGNDLVSLYKSGAVLSYLNGTPAKEIHNNKRLYQHATLRKVVKRKMAFSKIEVILDGQTVTIDEIKRNPSMSLLCDVDLSECVDVYQCVTSNQSTLIHLGDFVEYLDGDSNMNADIGLLLACFSFHGRSYCLVRMLQSMDTLGEPVCNEYDCPILCLSKLIYCVPSKSISRAVSVVHECSHTCTFVSQSTVQRIEHENVSCVRTMYVHDFTNNLYSHNIYCMN